MARREDIEIFPDMNFGIVHDVDEKPNNIDFQLHNHDDLYEILLFLGGDCEFHVEGNTYRLKPNDVILTRPFELHNIDCLSETPYDRIIIFVKSDYFKEKNCEEFLDVFRNRSLGTGNLIVSDLKDNSLIDCIKRLNKYSEKGEYRVADSVLYEFLYLINNAKKTSSDFYAKNENIRDMIVYINRHLTEELNLETLANEFFMSKYYMCKVFKKSTGYTVNQYVNYKRILLVQELHREGQTLLEASINAGFNNYANFYKSYVKQTGKAPSSME